MSALFAGVKPSLSQLNRSATTTILAAQTLPNITAQFSRTYASKMTTNHNEVVIVAAGRTPVGSFAGSLSKLSAVQLGATAIKGVLAQAGVEPKLVEEVYMGNVLQANLGQAPARQATILSGCPDTTEATTVNKVCASGMKAVMLAAQNLQLGIRSVMVAGGMESMSNSPYYVQRNLKYGHQGLNDSVVKDGLTDAYNNIHMGSCAEETAVKYKINREAQDGHAIESYKRAAAAWKSGVFDKEIIPVTISDKKGDIIVKEDEEYKNVNFDKIPGLKPVFQKENGTVTAANASSLNDGASALLLMTRQKADELNLKPLAQIISYADAACTPKLFTIAPSLAVPIALKRAGLEQDDVSLFEFNEAFSVVARANEQILGLDPKKVNVAGGAVALGHPIGSSGSRILVTLTHLLKSGQYGCAAICNGGGGASSIIIKKF